MKIQDILQKLRARIFVDKSGVRRNTGCTELEVDNWIISNFLVKKLHPIVGHHPYPVAELNLMATAICYIQPQQIFEWGTNIGKSARIFHEITKYFEYETIIHSIDLPDDKEHGEHPRSNRGKMVRGYSNVNLYQADGLAKSIEIYGRSPERKTLVFIDGDHSYESVIRELRGVIDAMPNANILLHDTFYQSADANYNIGPHLAIQEVLGTTKVKFKIVSTNMGLPGMTLLYQPINI
jgi:cephalosporin hydroxylase